LTDHDGDLLFLSRESSGAARQSAMSTAILSRRFTRQKLFESANPASFSNMKKHQERTVIGQKVRCFFSNSCSVRIDATSEAAKTLRQAREKNALVPDRDFGLITLRL